MGKPVSKVAISWIEIILVATLVIAAMGIWSFTEQQVNQNLKSQEPSLEAFQQAFQLSDLKRRFALNQDRLATTRKKMTEQQIELAQQNSKLWAMKATYPKLAKKSPESQAVPADIQKTYASLRMEQQSTHELVEKLAAKSLALDNHLTRATEKIFKAQESASEQFEAKKISYEWKKRSLTIQRASVVVLGAMTTLTIVLLLFRPENLKVILVIGITLVLQIILFGYQAFGIIGSASIALLFIFMFLGVLRLKVP
jgi:membrane-bound ClpP family serine protease